MSDSALGDENNVSMQKMYYGTQSTGNPIFDSQPMIYATTMIKRRDHFHNRAAKMIQRCWRASVFRTLPNLTENKGKKEGATNEEQDCFGPCLLWRVMHVGAARTMGEGL
jgi:hypothetical protein